MNIPTLSGIYDKVGRPPCCETKFQNANKVAKVEYDLRFMTELADELLTMIEENSPVFFSVARTDQIQQYLKRRREMIIEVKKGLE